MIEWRRFGVVLAIILTFVFTIQQGTALAQVRQENPSGLDALAYLPIVQSNEPLGIHGYVTDNGAPAANVDLDLRFWNGNAWSTRASTTTEADGRFRFFDIAKLNAGQAYYVRYDNDEEDTSRLSTWHTTIIESYSAGADVHIGDFDLANIVLSSPSPGAYVSVPRTFSWQKRSASPTDSYEFNLADMADGDPWAFTQPLGFVNNYTLQSLPPAFETDYYYGWFMWVYDGLGGYGVSYYFRWVAFSNTGAPIDQVPGSELLMRSAVQFDLTAMPVPTDFDPDR